MQITRKRILRLLALVAVTGLTANLAFGQVQTDSAPFPVTELQFVEDIPPPTREAVPLPTGQTTLAPESIPPGFDLPLTEPEQGGANLTLEGEFDNPYGLPVDEAIIDHEVAEVFSTNNWFRGGYWYSTQEFVMLLRDNIPLVHIAADFSGATGNINLPFLEAIDSKTADFVYEAGTRLSIGHVLGRDVGNRNHAVELSFLGLFDYTGRSDLAKVNPDAGAGISTFLASVEGARSSFEGAGVSGYENLNFVPGFSNADAQSILFRADFNSLELNYRMDARAHRDRLVMQPDGRWVRFDTPSRVTAGLGGLRYIRIDEVFQYRSVGPTADQLTDSGFYQVTTDNSLVGFQLGGEFTEKYTNWTWGIQGKIGGLVNFADRDSFVTSVSGGETDTRQQSLSDETFAGFAEASARGRFYLRPNTALRASYDFIFINGIAQAQKNIGLAQTFPKFGLTNNALLHGFSLGFEMTW